MPDTIKYHYFHGDEVMQFSFSESPDSLSLIPTSSKYP